MYLVKEGDTLAEIAARYGVATDVMWKMNQGAIRDPSQIFAGGWLSTPADENPPPPSNQQALNEYELARNPPPMPAPPDDVYAQPTDPAWLPPPTPLIEQFRQGNFSSLFVSPVPAGEVDPMADPPPFFDTGLGDSRPPTANTGSPVGPSLMFPGPNSSKPNVRATPPATGLLPTPGGVPMPPQLPLATGVGELTPTDTNPGGFSSNQMVERIFQNYSTADRYNERVGAGQSIMVNQDIDYLTDQYLTGLSSSSGFDLARQQLRYFADQLLRGNIQRNDLNEGLGAEYRRNGFFGADGTRRAYDDGTGTTEEEGTGQRPGEVVDPERNERERREEEEGEGEGTFRIPEGAGGSTEEPPDIEQPPRTDLELNSSKAFLQSTLERYDLGTLIDDAWAWVAEFKTDEEIMILLRAHPVYKARFPAMAARFEADLNAVTEEQYLALERGYHQILRASGLPTNFYDGRDDFTTFIANDMSALELQDRIGEGFRRVAQTDPAVRSAFQEFYGTSGDAALASMFLDPNRSAAVLMDQARTAEVAGLGQRRGIDIGIGQSEEIAAFSPSVGSINQGFNQVEAQRRLSSESLSETSDIRSGDLVSAAFNTRGASEARTKIENRRNSRLAAFSGGGGAAFFQGQGFVGTGVADS